MLTPINGLDEYLVRPYERMEVWRRCESCRSSEATIEGETICGDWYCVTCAEILYPDAD